MRNTKEKQEERSYTHKVGIRILSDTQLRNILPSYENLFAKIENCREVAMSEMTRESAYEEESDKKHYQYNFMYDNVFSILGKRGTGKTSVAFTLRERIKDGQNAANQDVVLPLIIPEVIPENCAILGWLLAIVKEQVNELEQEIQELEEKDKDKYHSRYGFYGDRQTKGLLMDKLDEINQMFFAGSYNPSNEMSYYRAIDFSIQQAADYYNFAQKIAELWDAWIRRIQYYHSIKKSGSGGFICPMIYFIFDDVDLAPDKISELLAVIIKYLSHPNLIVIVTAEENLFLQVIENQLDRKIGRLPREWREYLSQRPESRYDFWGSNIMENQTKNDDVVNQTAAMYLGKVLPPSTRYNLRLFHTAKEKANFYVEQDIRLGQAVREKIDELISCIDNPCCNFMMPNDTPIIFYLFFFGDTSRQISNVYISLKELIDSIEKIIINLNEDADRKEDCMDMLYQACRYFLCVALVSNHDLAKIVGSAEKFTSEILLFEYNQWKFYINYSYINEFLEEEVDDRNTKVRLTLQFYSLLAFMENILLLIEFAFPKGLTGREKIYAVPLMTEYIQRLAFGYRHIFRDDLPADTFFEHYDNLLDRLESIVSDETRSDMKFRIAYFYEFRNYRIKNKTTRIDLRKIARENPLWFKELVGMLTMVYGNAYLFDKNDMADCLVFRDKKYLVRYQRKIRNELQEYISRCFEVINLQDVWEGSEWREYLETDYREPDKSNKGFYELVEDVKRYIEEEKLYNDVDFAETTREEEGMQDNNDMSRGEDTGDEMEDLFVDLRLILDIVFSYINLGDYLNNAVSLQRLLSLCPYEIAHEFIENFRSIQSDRGLVKQMLADRVASIERIEYGWYGMGVLIDFVHVSDVIDRVYKAGGLRYKALQDIVVEISEYSYMYDDGLAKVDKGKMVLISIDLYRKLLNELSRVLEIADNDRYIDDDMSALLNDLREIFMRLDLCVDIYDNYELREAVQLGVEAAIVGVLQQIYFYQTVHERYISKNSLSSKELEQVGGKNTYYYNLFNQIVEAMEKEEKKDRKIDLQEKIRLAFAYERHKYTDQLITGAENE